MIKYIVTKVCDSFCRRGRRERTKSDESQDESTFLKDLRADQRWLVNFSCLLAHYLNRAQATTSKSCEPAFFRLLRCLLEGVPRGGGGGDNASLLFIWEGGKGNPPWTLRGLWVSCHKRLCEHLPRIKKFLGWKRFGALGLLEILYSNFAKVCQRQHSGPQTLSKGVVTRRGNL